MDEAKILDMCARYKRLYSAGVYDVMDEMGHPHQCLSLQIRPLEPNWVVAGPAFTIKWTAETRHPVELAQQKAGPNLFSIVDQFHPGCVLVMETGKSMNVGHWGELTGLMSEVRGRRGAQRACGLAQPGRARTWGTGVTSRRKRAIVGGSLLYASARRVA